MKKEGTKVAQGDKRQTDRRTTASRNKGRTVTDRSPQREKRTAPSAGSGSRRKEAAASGRSRQRPSSAGRPSSAQTRRTPASYGRARSGAGAQVRPAAASGRRTQQAGSRIQTGGSSRRTTSRPQGTGQHPQRRSRRRRQLRGWVKVAIALLAIMLIIRLLPFGQHSRAAAPTVSQTVSEIKSGVDSRQEEDATAAALVSDSAILINADNGDVLYEKDPDTPRPPASLTKMMTVYVAIKNNDDPDRELQMPKAAFEALKGQESTSGLSAGETVTLRDLLYAAILPSGGDAAMALALATSGNEGSFVDLMNQQAADLGMDSTHFENPIGTDADGQVSTCRDMARLLKAALGDTIFREVITARTYTTTANDLHPKGVKLTHTIDDYLSQFQRYFDASDYEITGGKTGYTAEAGNCLASIAEKEDAPTCIAVTMHATEASDNYYQSVKDAVTLYNTVYDQ